jgi:hypothetical protein
VAGDRLVVHGSAALAGDRPAHGVLLTVGERTGRRVVGIGEGRTRPHARQPYLHDHLFNEVELDPDEPVGLWRAKVDLARLPDAVVRIDAWVVDAGRMLLHPLPQRIVLDRAAGGDGRVRVISRAEEGAR